MKRDVYKPGERQTQYGGDTLENQRNYPEGLWGRDAKATMSFAFLEKILETNR